MGRIQEQHFRVRPEREGRLAGEGFGVATAVFVLSLLSQLETREQRTATYGTLSPASLTLEKIVVLILLSSHGVCACASFSSPLLPVVGVLLLSKQGGTARTRSAVGGVVTLLFKNWPTTISCFI